GIEADLRRLVACAAPDEPAAVLLVQLLAAQGREAQALDLLDALRRDLKEAYGVDPSPIVARAHVALLRGELAPAPARQPGVAADPERAGASAEPERAAAPAEPGRAAAPAEPVAQPPAADPDRATGSGASLLP